LDRFFARLSLGYPSRADEAEILSRQQVASPLDLVKQVVDLESFLEMQVSVRDVFVHDSVREYVVDVVRATRESNQLLMGASPRGSLLLMRAAQGHASMAGNDFVRPDDVKAMAAAVLAHRVLSRAESRARGHSTDQLISQIVEQVPAPVPVA
jgi:MoxR-like ATPase